MLFRSAGFLQIINQYPDCKVVGVEYCNSDTALAAKQARGMLEKYPDITAMVALNAMSAEGLGRTIDEMGLKGKVTVVTFDNSPVEINYLEENVIQATIVQNPFAMGYLGVKSAMQSAKGEKIPSRIDTGSTVIDLQNMYSPENQKLLFPFVK